MIRTVLLVSAAALVCRAASLPADSVLRQTSSRDGDGGYEYGFVTRDGLEVQQSGVVLPGGGLSVYGVYEYPDPVTGQVYRVQYVADENGFQPQGAHLVRSAGVRL